jgi:hypothetical protein
VVQQFDASSHEDESCAGFRNASLLLNSDEIQSLKNGDDFGDVWNIL